MNKAGGKIPKFTTFMGHGARHRRSKTLSSQNFISLFIARSIIAAAILLGAMQFSETLPAKEGEAQRPASPDRDAAEDE